MKRSIALAKIKKLLGNSFGYRVDLKAPTEDGRAEAHAQLRIAEKLTHSLQLRLSARRSEILDRDGEYLRLSSDYEAAKYKRADLSLMSTSFRFTVYDSVGPFPMVVAQGDSWEDVIKKLSKMRAA